MKRAASSSLCGRGRWGWSDRRLDSLTWEGGRKGGLEAGAAALFSCARFSWRPRHWMATWLSCCSPLPPRDGDPEGGGGAHRCGARGVVSPAHWRWQHVSQGPSVRPSIIDGRAVPCLGARRPGGGSCSCVRRTGSQDTSPYRRSGFPARPITRCVITSCARGPEEVRAMCFAISPRRLGSGRGRRQDDWGQVPIVHFLQPRTAVNNRMGNCSNEPRDE